MGRRIRIYLDMDGVLADFEHGYWELTGERLSDGGDVDWSRVPEGFFGGLRPLPWAADLVAFCYELDIQPTILTGIPRSVPTAAAEKRAWAQIHIPATPVITCMSRDKRDHGGWGAVLVDDRTKYASLWTATGGVFVHFREGGHSAFISTVGALARITRLLCPQCLRPVVGVGWCEVCA